MALMVAGTHSGCGKSTVALGIMAALTRLGLRVQPYKAGPDFIDAGLHALAAGRTSRNLDLWMCGEDYVKRLLHVHGTGADAAVIEGAMGYYDGGERSSASLAAAVGASVLLVVDAHGMAESAGALINGFRSHGGRVDAVVFNRVGSHRHFERLKEATHGVEVVGYLPRDVRFEIPERHLGLLTAEESPICAESLGVLSDAIAQHVDMARIAELARHEPRAVEPVVEAEPDVRIAVARDRAFCFYYEDNLDMLRRAGAEVVFFSPIADAALPSGIGAIYLGGGYPEVHAPELERNALMRSAIRDWVRGGRPLYAECGGFMYLGECIRDGHERYDMCGALPIETRMLPRRAALGYREARLARGCVLGPEGTAIRGHEFHYSVVTEARAEDGVCYNVMGETGPEVTSAMLKGTVAGYVHLHFGSNPQAAENMVRFIRQAGR